MSNFKPILVALLLVGLFALAFLNFGIMTAEIEGANQSISDDPSISAYAASLNQTLEASISETEAANTAFSNSSITTTTSFPFVDAIGGIWKTMKNAPIAVWNLSFGLLLSNVLGSEAYAMVIGVLGAILTMTIIFAVWKLIHSGEGG